MSFTASSAPTETKPEPPAVQAQSIIPQKAVDPRQPQPPVQVTPVNKEPEVDDHTAAQAQYSWGAPAVGGANDNHGGYEEAGHHGNGNNGYGGGDLGTGSPAIKEDGCVFTLRLVSLCFVSGRAAEDRGVREKQLRKYQPGCPGPPHAAIQLERSSAMARRTVGVDGQRSFSTLCTAADTSIGDLAHKMVMHCRSSNYEYLASTYDSHLAAAQVACVPEVTKWHWVFDSGDHILVSGC